MPANTKPFRAKQSPNSRPQAKDSGAIEWMRSLRAALDSNGIAIAL